MLPSERSTVDKLSKLQREFLLGHDADGFRPFFNDKQENDTRASLLARKLVRYEPPVKNKLGCPAGTILTDPLGRQARAVILGDYADALVMAMKAEASRLPPDELKQRALYLALTDCAAHWRREYRMMQEPRCNT